MGRLRVFMLLVSLLVLPGCFGLFGGTTATLTGTIRIDTSAELAPSSISTQSVARRFFDFPAGGAVVTPSIRPVQSVSRDPGPIEVLFYGNGLSDDEVRSLADRNGFTYLRGSRDGYHVLRDRMGRSESRAVGELKGVARGVRVEPNRSMVPLSVPNDPYFVNGEQWALEQINIAGAWEAVPKSHDPVIIAVVDSGIDFGHPELNDDDLWVDGWDLSSFRDPLYQGEGEPYGIKDQMPLPWDEDHGTMVSGVIAAITGNGIGIAGTVGNANVKLMPLRVFWRNQNNQLTTKEEVVAKAINRAVDHGANIINLSLGSDESCDSDRCAPPIKVLQDALNRAYNEGIVVVAAAGNGGGPILRPANYPTTIAVGASTRNPTQGKGIASYSNTGEEMDIVAPGGAGGLSPCSDNVRSLGLSGTYPCSAGTSVAAPHVSGILALMVASGVANDPDDLLQVLQITATDLHLPGWDKETGFGLVNAAAAVKAGVPQVFVARRSNNTLTVAGTPVRSEVGGVFRLGGVPEGTWILYGWVDTDSSGTVNDGDYFHEYGNVAARKGTTSGGLNLILTRYEGDELTVIR